VTKLTLTEIIDKLDRTTNQYNVILKDNAKLNKDVKSLQSDNALLFKKVVGLQDEIVQMMNQKNEEEEWVIGQREEDMRAKRTMSCIDTIKEKFDLEVTGIVLDYT
jgi:predicted  nucleic acid-binding Zn-ribbon protein